MLYSKKNFDIIKYLVKHGADVNKANKKEKTPLMYALINGNINTVQYLVEHGADVNKVNKKGYTPLRYIVNKKRLSKESKIVKYLLDQGANW